MKSSFDLQRIASVLESESEHQLRERLGACVRDLGFETYMFGLEVQRPLVQPVRHVASAYPAPWQAAYARNDYAAIDPTVAHCQTRMTPLLWSENLYAPNQRCVWEEARSFGLVGGLSIPVHGLDGVRSMISLARDQPLADEREVGQVMAAAQLLAHGAHVVASRLLVPPLMAATTARLTPREHQCLNWAARGKTAVEIALILGIAEPTAIHHLNSVVRKFNVANRIQAVAMGVSLGLVC